MKKFLYGFILISFLVNIQAFAAKNKKDASAKQESIAVTKTKSEFDGKRIAVVEPKMENGSDNEKWIPLFVQGQVTTNFQNYSGLEVIDRQNIDKAIKEQKLGTSAAYSEEGQIKIGELLTANYIVVISIIKKSGGYAIDAKINNAETNQTIGKAYSNANCPAVKLEDGSEINELSYNLLAGLGVDKNIIAALKDTSKIDLQKKEISANTNLAKGLALEKSDNGSIVEAMAYYQKAMSESNKITESAARLNTMTSNLSTGNIREKTLKEIQARSEWEKIWADYYVWAAKNYHIEIVYSTDLINYGKIYFEDEYVEKYNYKTSKNERIKFRDKNTQDVEIPIAVITECEQVNNLYAQLRTVYDSLPYADHVKNWKIYTERLPKKYSETECKTPFKLIFSVYDEAKERLGNKQLSSELVYSETPSTCSSFSYDKYFEEKKITSSKLAVSGIDTLFVKIPCKAEKLTDEISIKIEVEGITAVVKKDNTKNHLVKNIPGFNYCFKNVWGKNVMLPISSIEKYSGGWSFYPYKVFSKNENRPYLCYMPEYFCFERNDINSSTIVNLYTKLLYCNSKFCSVQPYSGSGLHVDCYDLYSKLLGEEEKMPSPKENGERIKEKYVDGTKYVSIWGKQMLGLKKDADYVIIPSKVKEFHTCTFSSETNKYFPLGLKINGNVETIWDSFCERMHYPEELVIGHDMPIERILMFINKAADKNTMVYLPYKYKEEFENNFKELVKKSTHASNGYQDGERNALDINTDQIWRLREAGKIAYYVE